MRCRRNEKLRHLISQELGKAWKGKEGQEGQEEEEERGTGRHRRSPSLHSLQRNEHAQKRWRPRRGGRGRRLPLHTA
jgi:hypothetical protein